MSKIQELEKLTLNKDETAAIEFFKKMALDEQKDPGLIRHVLIAAIRENLIELAKLMITANDYSLFNNSQAPKILGAAVTYSSVELTELMIQKIDKKLIYTQFSLLKTTVLHEAIEGSKEPKIVEMLIKAAPGLSLITNCEGFTPLDLILWWGPYTREDVCSLKILIENGASLSRNKKIMENYSKEWTDYIDVLEVVNKIINEVNFKYQPWIEKDLFKLTISNFKSRIAQDPLKLSYDQLSAFLKVNEQYLPKKLFSKFSETIQNIKNSFSAFEMLEGILIALKEGNEGDVMSGLPFRDLIKNYGKSNFYNAEPEQRKLDFYLQDYFKYTGVGEYLRDKLRGLESFADDMTKNYEIYKNVKEIHSLPFLPQDIKSSMDDLFDSYNFIEEEGIDPSLDLVGVDNTYSG